MKVNITLFLEKEAGGGGGGGGWGVRGGHIFRAGAFIRINRVFLRQTSLTVISGKLFI